MHIYLNTQSLGDIKTNKAFHDHVMQQAAARLKGKERNKNRPYLGLKSIIAGIAFSVKPELCRSSEGWTLDGEVIITIPVRARNSSGSMQDFKLEYRISTDASVRSTRRYPRTPRLTEDSDETLLAYINLVASDPLRYFPLLNADHCGICGKTLTDPESMAVGIGPECIKHFYLLVEIANEDVGQVIAEIKELRRQMQKAHPDRGGDADVFISLRKEFERLRALEVAK